MHGLRDITGRRDRLEDPVDDAAVVMDVPVEGGTEAVDEAHRPEAGMRAGAAAPTQMGPNDAQQDVQHGADRPRLALQVPAQPFGQRLFLWVAFQAKPLFLYCDTAPRCRPRVRRPDRCD